MRHMALQSRLRPKSLPNSGVANSISKIDLAQSFEMADEY